MMRRWRSRVRADRGDGAVRLRIAAIVAFEQQSASAEGAERAFLSSLRRIDSIERRTVFGVCVADGPIRHPVRHCQQSILAHSDWRPVPRREVGLLGGTSGIAPPSRDFALHPSWCADSRAYFQRSQVGAP
jgi:hypothetical protein